MAKLTALYRHPTDPAAFEEYYANTHAPLVEKIPNLRQFEAGKVIATPDGSEPPYYWIADLYFESVEQVQSSMGLSEGLTDGAGFGGESWGTGRMKAGKSGKPG